VKPRVSALELRKGDIELLLYQRAVISGNDLVPRIARNKSAGIGGAGGSYCRHGCAITGVSAVPSHKWRDAVVETWD
jgi:hypothetical protein